MDVCKCIVPLRHEGTPNSRRAASPLVWLVEEEESPQEIYGTHLSIHLRDERLSRDKLEDRTLDLCGVEARYYSSTKPHFKI
ncbi:hypothetical protein TNCV_1480371 [Trichonephila clavipes]|nr:hypothetical protein TNCV_1480371 [Trichonephila clavipes]